MPTYNERENLEAMAARVRASVPDADLLVVDDNSPDGTGDLADKLAAEDSHVRVLHRPGKGGLGAAYIAGFRWALDQDYGAVVEMDADGSHQPEQLPDLLDALEARRPGARLPLGARGAGSSTGRDHGSCSPAAANIYARLMLGIPLSDATGGFRVYRADTLRAIGLDEIDSQGYCFQIDLARRTLGAGLRVVEVPITFVERVHGTSKMSKSIMLEAFWRVGWWGLDRGGWLRRSSALGRVTLPGASSPRWLRIRASRSARTSSRSAMDRRSRSMSQWLRGGLALRGADRSPVLVNAVTPHTRHSQVAGTSASAANGTVKW